MSANYALGNGVLVGTVDEDRRAWTSSSAEWDGRAVTIEVANSVAAEPWPVSDADFTMLARLIADVAIRYNFPINDNTILTHQELYRRYGASYATACPGDMQRRKGELLALARTFQTGTPAGTIRDEDDMPLNATTDYDAFKTMLQRALRFDVRPDGAGADWKLGPTLWERLGQIETVAKQSVTPEQVSAIAAQIVKAIGQPTVTIDAAAIARAVNDESARRLAS